MDRPEANSFWATLIRKKGIIRRNMVADQPKFLWPLKESGLELKGGRIIIVKSDK